MKKFFPLLTLLTPILFFHKAFTNFFAADDFFILKMSQANSLKDFLLFFSPKETYGHPFFRPLVHKLYPFFVKLTSGLNPLPFHIYSFTLFLVNVFLVYQLINLFTRKKDIALFSAFLYSFNASHFLSLYWIILFSQISMTTFFFSTVYLFYKKNKLAYLTFILALFSIETAITLPFILLLITFIFFPKKQKQLLPFFVILIFYFFIRLGFGNPLTEKNYLLSLSPKTILNSLLWFTLWSFGLPEMLLDFIGPGPKLNPNFINWYLGYGLIFLASFLILIPWLFAKSLNLVKKHPKTRKLIVFFILWFVLTLGPVLFFPWHKFTYYLTIPLLGIAGLLSTLLVKTSKIPRLIIVLTLLILSFTSIKLSEKTHWVVKRAKIAHFLIKKAKEKYPSPPKGANIYLTNDPDYPFISKEWGGSSTQAHHALSGESAFQVFYNDYSLKVYFEDLNPPPKDAQDLLPLKAVIPN